MVEPQTLELADLVDFLSGGTPSRQSPNFWGGDIPWISGKDMKSFRLNGSIEHITEAATQSGTKCVDAGALLVLVRGMALFKGVPIGSLTCRAAFNQDVKALVPKSETDPTFLAYAVAAQAHTLRSFVTTAGHGTGRLITEALETLPIWLPSRPEQQRIAAVLDAWDEAIDASQKLAVVKERHAELIRRKLIQGNAVSLMDAAAVTFSGVDKKVGASEKAIALCNYLHIWRNKRLTSGVIFDQGSANLREIATFGLHEGDFIFTKDSETADEIAEVAYVAETMPDVVCGYHLALARPKDGYSGRYLTHAIRAPSVRNEFAKRANGAIRFGLTLEALEQIELPVPEFEQQERIAAVLDSFDDVVEKQRSLTSLLRAQERGLMQKLLTGEWRTPQSIDALLPGGGAADKLVEATE